VKELRQNAGRNKGKNTVGGDRKAAHPKRPMTKALSDVIFKMLLAPRKVSLVLDALYESKTRDDVLMWITDMLSNSDFFRIQLLCTSRPDSGDRSPSFSVKFLLIIGEFSKTLQKVTFLGPNK
jgi:hypothetical protein